MVQPKYNPQESLERIKLMMGYDPNKTLSENKETIKPLVNEDVPGVAAGTAATAGALGAGAGALGLVPGTAALTGAGGAAFSVGTALGASTATGALALGAGVLAGAAGLAVVPLAYWLINKDTGDAAKVKKLIQMCSSEAGKIAKLPRKINDKQIRNLSDQINDAVNYSTLGFMAGTDEESLFGAFKSLRNGTASDACALVNKYNSDYGDLYDDLDGDIDSPSEWKEIYRPLRDCVEDSLLTIKDDTVEQDCKKNPNQPKCQSSKQNPNKTGGTKYKSCTGTYSINCKADAISTVQACVGLNPDGKFGPKTEAKLKELGYTSFKDADVTTICSKVKGEVKTPEPEVSGEDVAINTTDTNF